MRRQRDLSLLQRKPAVLPGLFYVCGYVTGIRAADIYKRTVFPVLVFDIIRHIKLPPYKKLPRSPSMG